MSEISEKERAFIRHALGLTRSKIAYRNRYHAGGKDVETGLALTAKGMAIHISPSKDFPDDFFAITTRGFEAARASGETLDREEAIAIRRWDQRAFIGAK